jgi:hypothetical protein
MKICKKCNLEKTDENFSSNGRCCTQCKAEAKTIYRKEHYEKNKDKISKLGKEKYLNNKEVMKAKTKQYRLNNLDVLKLKGKTYYETNKKAITKKNTEYVQKHIEKTKQYKKQWAQENKVKIAEKHKDYYNDNKDRLNYNLKERIKNDPIFALTVALRKNILKAFRNRAYEKTNSTTKILGCSFSEFKDYIENQFESWMNWNNRGLYNGTLNYGWDIDHIEPLDTAITEDDVIRLNHYTNLRPLCSYTNRVIKKAKRV